MDYSIKNISKRYGFKMVINDLSYDFKSGLYLVTGKNGSGKSTLLKIIAKLVYPSNSNYFIPNEKICYINERVELSDSTPRFYLNMVKKINNVEANIKELMNEWNVPNKQMSSLSKGNRQKVSLISAYLTDANIYLFDEPTDSLDKKTIVSFVNMIKFFIEQDKIIIISTHEESYFNNVCYEEINLDETNSH